MLAVSIKPRLRLTPAGDGPDDGGVRP